MQRLAVGGLGFARPVLIWKPACFAAPAMAATLAARDRGQGSGFERAAHDPLGARE